jgi:hypothetical protein
MPIILQSLARDNGAACDHVTLTVNDDGITRTKKLSLQDLQQPISVLISDMPDDAAWKFALVIGWLRYQRIVRSRTVNQIVASLPATVVT